MVETAETLEIAVKVETAVIVETVLTDKMFETVWQLRQL